MHFFSRYRPEIMKQKFSTLLEDDLYRRTKVEAARSGKAISDVVGEALTLYLVAKQSAGTSDPVADTWGSLRIDRGQLRDLMAEESLLEREIPTRPR